MHWHGIRYLNVFTGLSRLFFFVVVISDKVNCYFVATKWILSVGFRFPCIIKYIFVCVLSDNVELCLVDLMLTAKWERRRILFRTGIRRQIETIYYRRERERGRVQRSQSKRQSPNWPTNHTITLCLVIKLWVCLLFVYFTLEHLNIW